MFWNTCGMLKDRALEQVLTVTPDAYWYKRVISRKKCFPHTDKTNTSCRPLDIHDNTREHIKNHRRNCFATRNCDANKKNSFASNGNSLTMATRAHSFKRICRNSHQAVPVQDRAHGKQSHILPTSLKQFPVSLDHTESEWPTVQQEPCAVNRWGRIDPNEQLSIIYRALFKDFSSNYTGHTSRMVATRIRHTAIRRAAPKQFTRFENPERLNFLLGDS